MARRTRTVYLGERNKGLSSTFQPPKEGRRVQQPKHCDKHGDKDEVNKPKNLNNVHNTSSQKYRQLLLIVKSTVVEGEQKAPFSKANTHCVGEGVTLFPGSKEVSSTIFLVFSMTQLGNEPQSSGPLANTLPTRPMSRYSLAYICRQMLHIWNSIQVLFIYDGHSINKRKYWQKSWQ